MKKNLYFIFAILLFASLGFAQEGHEAAAHGEEGIPWEMIGKQAFNFAILVGVLGYVLGSKIGTFFKGRVDHFEKQLVMAKKAKEDAELQRKDIENRLEQLKSSSAESIESARREAEALRAKIRAEAEAFARQIREDAKATALREVENAKHELQDEVLAVAMSTTREMMKTSVNEPDQKRLQNEFVQKIQVTR